MERETPANRRRFLSLVGGVGTAALAGCTTALSNYFQSSGYTADNTMTVGPDSRGLTDDERKGYIDRIAKTYGSVAVDKIRPDAGTLSRQMQPGIVLGDRIWDGEQSLAVTDASGTTLAESDNYVAVYENAQPSSLQEDYYVYWLWSGARPREGSALRNLWSHIDITGGGEVRVYNPGGDRQDNGTVGPHPEKTGQGTDEFAVRWRGDRSRTQVVTGSLSESRGDGSERGFEWAVHLASKAR